MSLSSSAQVEVAPVWATDGCGTIESPWTGWERQVESAVHGPARTFLFAAGFWAATRPVRLGTGVGIAPERPEEGRPWFLPADEMESLLLVDGAHEIAVGGVCFEGRGGRARHAVLVRCGMRVGVRGCRFDDFAAPRGAAVRLAGESPDRWVRGVAVEGCTFLNGRVGVLVERDASDLLVADNRFEEFTGPAIDVDPRGKPLDCGLLVVKNRIRSAAPRRDEPLLRVAAGAVNLRLAENALEGPETDEEPPPEAPAAIEIRGADPSDLRRVEVLLNSLASIRGPALAARGLGPGFVASGNHVVACGTSRRAAIELAECDGAVVEDNDVRASRGDGVRLSECRRVRASGNEIAGAGSDAGPRSPGAGIVVDGTRGRRIRLADNRVSGTRDAGIVVAGGTGLRLVGNEVRDCGEGIRIRGGRALVVVGNDCRDNDGTGLAVDTAAGRGLVALNRAAGNGTADLSVRGRRVRRRDNQVDRED